MSFAWGRSWGHTNTTQSEAVYFSCIFYTRSISVATFEGNQINFRRTFLVIFFIKLLICDHFWCKFSNFRLKTCFLNTKKLHQIAKNDYFPENSHKNDVFIPKWTIFYYFMFPEFWKFSLYLQFFLSVILSLFFWISMGYFSIIESDCWLYFFVQILLPCQNSRWEISQREIFFIALERLLNLHHSSQQATYCKRSSSSSPPVFCAAGY